VLDVKIDNVEHWFRSSCQFTLWSSIGLVCRKTTFSTGLFPRQDIEEEFVCQHFVRNPIHFMLCYCKSIPWLAPHRFGDRLVSLRMLKNSFLIGIAGVLGNSVSIFLKRNAHVPRHRTPSLWSSGRGCHGQRLKMKSFKNFPPLADMTHPSPRLFSPFFTELKSTWTMDDYLLPKKIE
jgi:hypothetical protein